MCTLGERIEERELAAASESGSLKCLLQICDAKKKKYSADLKNAKTVGLEPSFCFGQPGRYLELRRIEGKSV